MEQTKKELTGIEYFEDPYSCASGADALVIVTERRQFRAVDLKLIKADMIAPIIVDCATSTNRKIWLPLGFKYESVGRP